MISTLSGRIRRIGAGFVVLETGGIGWQLHVPSTTIEVMVLGERVTLLTELIVREDEMTLVGFATEHERSAYRLLCAIQGVGRAVAMALLALDTGLLLQAVRAGDARFLAQAKGVGPRLAARILVEAGPKLATIELPGLVDVQDTAVRRQALQALVGLGVGRDEAGTLLRRLAPEPGADLGVVINGCLRLMRQVSHE